GSRWWHSSTWSGSWWRSPASTSAAPGSGGCCQRPSSASWSGSPWAAELMVARPQQGFLAGVAGAGKALGASLSARYILGLVSLPEPRASLRPARLPPAVFGTLLVSLRYVARPLLLVTLALAFLAVGGLAGVVLRALPRISQAGLARWHPMSAQPAIG